MLPILSFGEQFPTSIGVMRGSLMAQRCHRAQATHSIHLLLPTFLFFPPYFLFLRRSHYDYGAELILLAQARFGFRCACKSRLDHHRRNPVRSFALNRVPRPKRSYRVCSICTAKVRRARNSTRLRTRSAWRLLPIVFMTISFFSERS